MEEKRKVFKKILEAIGKQAFENDKLSFQELQILKQVSYDLNDYEYALKKALDDGIITDYENKTLTKLKNQINNNAIQIANIDNMIDTEEEQMLKRLCEALDKYL